MCDEPERLVQLHCQSLWIHTYENTFEILPNFLLQLQKPTPNICTFLGAVAFLKCRKFRPPTG